MSLDAGERLVRVVVSLLHQTQLLSLLLVQPRLHGVLLLEPLQCQNEQLGVVLVIQRWERNGRELSRLEPVHSCSVDGNCLLSAHVRSILQVVVLPLLLSFEPQACKSAKVFLARGFVHGGTSANTLSIVVGGVCPPVCLGLDVAKDHVFNGRWQPRDLPRDVCFPASPCLGQMLQDGAGFVCTNTLRHHVNDIVHDGCTELQVEVTLHALLRDGLGHTLTHTALELPGQEVAKPSLKQRHDSPKEEEPNAPAWCPEAATWTLAYWTRVETVVDEVL
mmetsp:Transcript_45139/g.81181  ORF Transcript_45139/g.81181 Transcript_45139/m.81181 type:complete len:277 (+) Transcript_45139:4424-5254(+)